MIPVREVATKEGFTGIKSFTRGDKLAALPTSPQLLRRACRTAVAPARSERHLGVGRDGAGPAAD